MRGLFVDTAGWFAMAWGGDPAHRDAVAERDGALSRGELLVSTDFVMDETLTLLRARFGMDAASQWWDQVEASTHLRWEWIDPARAEKARRWFFQWRDKDFSFTDCTSFVVMRELGLRTALTTDRHFGQAEFDVVP